MKIVVIGKDNIKRINRILKWFIYMIGYALVLITVSVLFKSVNISNEYFGLYGLLAAVIIYLLNQTIKPIIFLLTLPITGLTLGLFYPFINVLILYITHFILGDKFTISGIIAPFFIAILISIMNILMDELIIKPLIKKGDINE